jgi:hypothetical protein
VNGCWEDVVGESDDIFSAGLGGLGAISGLGTVASKVRLVVGRGDTFEPTSVNFSKRYVI